MSDQLRVGRWWENLPSVSCGRKFCRVCGKWKILVYFHPRIKNGREYPGSECDGCNARNTRKSYKKLTPDQKIRRTQTELNRLIRLGRIGDLSADLPTRVSALSFQIYVSRFIYELEIVPDSESGRPQDAQLAKHINGVPLLESDKRALDRWKSGDVKTIGMRLADEFASRYDLPFWEIEEEAGKMLG